MRRRITYKKPSAAGRRLLTAGILALLAAGILRSRRR